jgi:phosphoglycerate dehydrogenase-like enzyme
LSSIAIIDDWQGVAHTHVDWSTLQSRAELVFYTSPFPDEDAVVDALIDFDIVLAMRERTRFPASLVRRLPNMRMFGLTGNRAGLIDIAEMIERGITVCYTGGGPSVAATAELALGLMLAAARDIPAGDLAVRGGRFQQGTRSGLMLSGKTIGLIGLGRIGALMARYCQALDMRVLAWSPNLTSERAAAAGVLLAGKDELLSNSDVVSLHLVLSERTQGILSAADISRMKQGAILVNTSRANLVDQYALAVAIHSRRLIAALDVHAIEPVPVEQPINFERNTILTPHYGYSVDEVYAEYYQHSYENVLGFLEGKPIRVLTEPNF